MSLLDRHTHIQIGVVHMLFELLQGMEFENKIPRIAMFGTLRNCEKEMRSSCASGDIWRNKGYSQGDVDHKTILVISCVQEVLGVKTWSKKSTLWS